MNKPKYIIVHCSATKVTSNITVEQIVSMHKQRGFNTIGYHYYITKDGVIHKGRDESIDGAHCLGYNAKSIGICYEGGLDKNGKAKDTRTDAQKESLISLIKQLKGKYKIDKVMGHRDTSPDKDGDGIVEPHEWIKQCPCFNAIDEYKNI